jgi:manganese-dependent inorganic pyrophosphatase
LFNKVYVFGHKNPDSDSLCSAIAYSNLKNSVDEESVYTPFVLGNLNPESKFILSYFGVEKPEILKDVYAKVEDVMIKDVITANYNDTLRSIGDTILSNYIRDIPLVDDEGKLMGMITERRIARNFMKGFKDFTLRQYPLKVRDIIDVMNGQLLSGDIDRLLKGRPMIAAMSFDSIKENIHKDDVLIVGDREDIHNIAIEKEVECIIVTGGLMPSDEIILKAREKNIVMILTPHVTYVAGRLLRLSSPARRIMEKNFLTLSPKDILKDIEEDLMDDQNGVAVVVDDDMKVKGIITRHDLINPPRKKVILVDHSEKSQTVEGIEEAEIIEIIDHHRLGGLQTGQPITAYIKPVGCTSTIIWRLYKSHGIMPSKPIMGLMLSAILSDTVLLRSPTTTKDDIIAVNELGAALNIDIVKYGMEMYKAKSDLEGLSVKEIINMDIKDTNMPKGKIAVSQIEVIDPKQLLSKKSEILEEMENLSEKKGYTLFLLMITDIINGASDILAYGNKKIVEKAFQMNFENDILHLDGVVSRKKQIMPKLLKYL